MKTSMAASAWLRVCWGAALVCLAACGDPSSTGGSGPSGAIDFGLQLAPGATVSNANYTITGPNGYASAGSVPVGDSADVVVPLSGLPIGTGYLLRLKATASDGETTCTGSTAFDVTTTSPFTVTVHLVCAGPTGTAAVSATLNTCPLIDSLGASPTDVRLGGTVALTASAHDSDLGPSALTYRWKINNTPLTSASQPNFNFVCTSAGTFTFTLGVSDGDPTPGCADNLSVTARCTAP